MNTVKIYLLYVLISASVVGVAVPIKEALNKFLL